MIVVRLLLLPLRLVNGSIKAGYRAGRLVGASRALFFGLGFATGVVVASPTARRLAFTGAAKGVKAVADARAKPEPPADPAPVTTAATGLDPATD